MANLVPVDFDPFASSDGAQPRGVRNNNPLNIEAGSFTQSQPGFSGSDGRFARFESPDQGFAAAENLLNVYGQKHGINTVAGVINRWAPSSDGNPVNAYAAHVARSIGVDPNQPIDLRDPATRAKMADAMATFENGRPIPRATDASAQPSQTNEGAARLVPVDHDPFSGAPASFNSRFGKFDRPLDGGDNLRAGLLDKSQAMTRGQALPPSNQMLTEYTNVLGAASQGTAPSVDRYKGKLVSADVFETDSGEVAYRDPQSGKIVPTDSKTQIALRDPVDGQIKVFSRSDDTNESGIVGASRVLSQGLAAGAPTARPGLAEPVAKSVVPRASEIAATAKPYYKAFRNEAGKIALSADDSASIASRLRGALDRVNLTEDMAGAPAKAALKMLEDGTVSTLDDLQKVKRVAGRGFNNSEKDARDAAAAISGEVGRIISDVSKSAAQNLRMADDIFSTSRSVQDLQRKASIADLRTGRAGYGGNAVNSMRQVLSPIVENSINGKTTGFQPGEIAAIREIVEGTPATNALRTVGQLSPSKGILATVAAGSTGGVTGVVGAISNKAAAVLTGKQIDRLTELVAKRSPKYAEAVDKALSRYEQAQASFVNNPAPNTFAGYLSASRALSAGFARDGINVTSGDLLRSIQGPVKSAADDEQPKPERVGNQ